MQSKQFRKRTAILDCLKSTQSHPSAEMVHALLQAEHPDISLATVYRNLARFKAEGMIQSLGTVGGIERFDACTDPHVHFICSSCSSVLDLPEMEYPTALCHQAQDRTGCQVDACQLTFTGLCQSCRASAIP